MRAPPELAAGQLVFERYRVLERVGAGAHGVVHLGVDELTDAPVALKYLLPDVPWTHVQREITALWGHRLPCLPSLLDAGRHNGRHTLVMEWVPGSFFPGQPTPMPWSQLAPLARSLLRAVADLHRIGVWHLDLKPDNVLVHERSARLVDLGLARGRGVERCSTITSALGALRYASPEQLRRERVDGRSDVYACGLLLYEALSGRLPQSAPNDDAVAAQRLYRPPEPISTRGADAPDDVVRCIDQMVAREPSDRPTNLFQVLNMLGIESHFSLPSRERWTPSELRDLFVADSRFDPIATDAADLLYQRTGGQHPLVSAELGAWVDGGWVQRGESGLRLTRADLSALSTRPPAADHDRPPITVTPILELLHAAAGQATARELSLALGASEPTVQAELLALHCHGDATELPGARWRTTGAHLPTRRSVHAALAMVFNEGTWSSVFHAAHAGDPAVAIDNALRGFDLAVESGDQAGAISVLNLGLWVARTAEPPTLAELELELVVRRTDSALVADTAKALEEALADVARLASPTRELEALRDLLLAARHVQQRERALQHLEAVPKLRWSRLESHRHALFLQIAHRAHGDISTALDEVRARVEADGRPFLRRLWWVWLGRHAYVERRFREAASYHERAIEGATWATDRLSAHLNAAAAWVETDDLERATCHAVAAEALARKLRHPVRAARAFWLARSARARRREPLLPDVGYLEDVRALGVAWLTGACALTEAVIAWRAGTWALARQLAKAAQGALLESRQPAPADLASALATACGAPEEPGLATRMSERADPEFDWQGLALLGDLRALDLARDLPRREQIRDVISPNEVRDIIGSNKHIRSPKHT